MKVALPIAAPGKTTVGFIGIGIMGLAMARNLIKAGYDVIVWNRNTSKCAPLVEAGAKLATSPRDVTSRATYTFAMLSDPTAVLSAALGPNGAVAGLSPGKGYIDVSTVDAATSRQVGAAVSSAGGSFLEAPVSGSKGPAEQGTLIFLTAGDQELYTAVENPLKAMGKAAFFLGNAGAAAEMKLVVNMLMGGMMACFSESLVLAKKAGLEEKDLIDVIKLGAVAAPMFALKGPTMVKGAYNPAFPCKHQHKDMRLALELGEKVKMDLPVAKAAHALFSQAVEGGLGDLDFSAVIEAVKK
nr:glyoxylate/succinic semialdehyde reductase 2 (GLYR2) [Polytomella parva]|eukprot:CAMPEP_0175051858 /NCGR_PEP_ID=MMETSP0052_2-20121109/8040_1 /TAXON_ID=51329 ORGANISM="Polytomella parva, Strain SAG 63-3" /NCGR_SAMPLE_ID=MMETSP0052_2 /ASSEMBLY_ACC=CAM_ASM_000194 /LENGTH=298 /DNA_ID=CAMNT_0016316203 /DNA_START=302 /DNA_END=1198 /DNA_ORIENTATION=+